MKKIIYIFMFIWFLNMVSATITIDINIETSFDVGETVKFEYSIISDSNTIVTYTPYLICPNAPVAFLHEKTAELKANQPYPSTYQDQIVQDWFEPQICTAYIQILSPMQKKVSKEFQIITDPGFLFDIKLDKKIFIKNENIYLSYISDIQDIRTVATLIDPNKTTKQITLPTSIKAEQIGTYELEVSASKEGYKDVSLKEQFGVIEKNAVISGNVVEDRGNKSKNLFSNFTEKIKVGDKKYLFFVLIIFVSFIFIIILIIKRKRDAEYDALSN